MGKNYSLKEPYLAGLKIGNLCNALVYRQTLIRSMHLSKRHTYPLQLCCPLNYGDKQALNYINKSSMETTV
jgi:hypothetical protein